MARLINPKGIRHNNTTIRVEGHRTIVRLYSTDIVTIDRLEGLVTFNTGGFDTPTTLRRMNEVVHHYRIRIPELDRDGMQTRLGKEDFRSTNTLTFRFAAIG